MRGRPAAVGARTDGDLCPADRPRARGAEGAGAAGTCGCSAAQVRLLGLSRGPASAGEHQLYPSPPNLLVSNTQKSIFVVKRAEVTEDTMR